MDLVDLIKQFAAINKYFDRTYPHLRREFRILARLGKISEELGELNSAIHGELKLHRPEKQAAHKTEDVAKEWADVFNTVVLCGLALGLDLPKAISERLQEISARLKIDLPGPLTTKALFSVGVIVTIYNDQGQVLIAKRSPHKAHAAGSWENISGAVEAGEQPIDALRRELAEELGESIEYEVGEIYNSFHSVLDNGRKIIGISYLCHYFGGEITLNDEHTEYAWVTLAEAIRRTKTLGLKKELAALGKKFPEKFRKS